MQNIFFSSSRPFYQSVSLLQLDAIREEEYVRFVIDSYQPFYQSTLSLLPERQKEIHYAIAKEGKAIGITSGVFIKKHGLLSQSSVQTAVKQLFDKEIINSENNVYQVYDRFFGLWLANLYGTGWKG